MAYLPEQTIDYTGCPATERYFQKEEYRYFESID